MHGLSCGCLAMQMSTVGAKVMSLGSYRNEKNSVADDSALMISLYGIDTIEDHYQWFSYKNK